MHYFRSEEYINEHDGQKNPCPYGTLHTNWERLTVNNGILIVPVLEFFKIMWGNAYKVFILIAWNKCGHVLFLVFDSWLHMTRVGIKLNLLSILVISQNDN